MVAGGAYHADKHVWPHGSYFLYFSYLFLCGSLAFLHTSCVYTLLLKAKLWVHGRGSFRMAFSIKTMWRTARPPNLPMSAARVGGESGLGNRLGPLGWAPQAKSERTVSLPRVTVGAGSGGGIELRPSRISKPCYSWIILPYCDRRSIRIQDSVREWRHSESSES